MKYLKYMPMSLVENASRNKRELSAAHDYGFETYCYSYDSVTPESIKNEPFTHICSKHSKPTKKSKPVKVLLTVRNIFSHMHSLKKINADVISCHNILGCFLAYTAYLFTPKKRKPKFIYDSHEFELRKKKRGKLSYNIIKAYEKFMLKRIAFAIMINDGIADGVAQIHNYDYNRVIIRSTPDYWNIDPSVSKKMHDEFCEKLSVPKDSFFVLYHGILAPYRGLEELYKAMTKSKNFYAVTVGDFKSNSYKNRHDAFVKECGVEDRIIRYPLQSHEKLWEYVSAADCGVVLNNTDNPNYIYALPNKFFENIQSLTPIICTDSIEMARIVNQYDIGILTPSGDGDKLAENIELMLSDKENYKKFKENLVKAKEELCWEKEKERFFDAFEKYL